MALIVRAAAGAALVLSLAVAPGVASAGPRILSSSVGIAPKRFEARVVVADAEQQVAKVVFSLKPRCSADPSAAKYAAVPEVSTSQATVEGDHRVFTADVPDPSGGTFGAWTLRSTALDASGKVIGRHQTVVVRTFSPRFASLAFETPKGRAAPLDTSAGPASARLVMDLEHDAPITSVGLITSAHDDPVLGYTRVPAAIAADRAKGTTPWLTSRLEQAGPTSLVGHFAFPARTPPMKLAVERVVMTDARCRTADVAPPSPLALSVTSSKPQAMPVDVRLDREALGRGQLVVAFRLIGPPARTAPAPEIGGAAAPVLTVRLLDDASPPNVLGSTPARPAPAPGGTWDGQSMAIAPIAIPDGPTALGAALKRGLGVEIEEGGKTVAPRAVLRAR
jgi:hypothetical protein